MTDTGQVPGEGLPESAGMVEQPGAPAHGAYAYLSETTAEDEDLLLLPGAQSAWGNEVAPPAPEPVVETVHEPGPHETAGRDSGSVDLSAVRLPGPSAPQAAPRRPLHLGPPIPDASASPVRSLADRGPAGAPVRQIGQSASGPEYLDAPHLREMPPQGASPWGSAQPPVEHGATAAETVAPAAVAAAQQREPVGVAQAVVARVATEAIAATAPQEAQEAQQAQETEVVGGEAPVSARAAAGYGVVDPGELLGAAMMAEAEQAPAVAVAEAGQHAADVPLSGDDGTAHGTPGPAADAPVDAPQAPEAAHVPPVPESAHGDQPVAAAEGTPPAEPAVVQAAEEAVPTEVTEPAETAAPAEASDANSAADTVAQAADAGQPSPAEAQQQPEPQQPVESVESVEPVEPHADLGDTPAQPQAHEAPAAEAVPVAGFVPAPGTTAEVPVPDAVVVPEPTPAEPTPAPAVAHAPEPVATVIPDVPEPAAPAEELPGPVAEAPAPEATFVPEVPAPAAASESGLLVDAFVASAEVAAAAALAVPPAPQAEPAQEQSVEPLQDVRSAPLPEPEQQPEVETPHETLAQAAHVTAPVSHIPEATVPGTAAEPEAAPEAEAAVEPAPEAQAPVGPSEPAPAAALAEDLEPEPEPEPEQAPEPQPEPPTAESPVEAPPAQVVPEPVAVAVPVAVDATAVQQPAQQHALAHAQLVQEPVTALASPAAPLAAQQERPDRPVGSAASDQPLGRFVPVEGTVPSTPHLAPTPPHPLVLPTEEQPAHAVAEPGQTAGADAAPTTVTVPAPRGADPASAPATPDTEPETGIDPDVAQSPEDLETRAADQEESPAPVEEVRESTGPAAPAYDDAEREAVLKVMRERRDIRNGFRADPIPHEVLLRVLEAAHTAPSVGHSQPWDFVVIRSADTRQAMHELATRQRDAYAKSLPKGRAKQFKELKIEAILDTTVNIVVTADPTRGGRHTLGRHTQPQMAPYSSALAVENLWLAARAEGLGVGWVSFFDEREMVRALGLPEHLEVVAYLCVGYVDEFPDEPELMQAGWAKRRPLSWVVHEETYGRRALPGEDPHDLLAETVASVRPLDAKALGEAWERQKRMTKPPGSLGMLEIISAQLSGLSRQCPPPIPEPAAVAIFAGDHGVHAQGVTPWPQEVTAQMVANFLGGGAVCNAFATQVGAEVCVVDVGVAAELPATPGLLPRKIRAGTSDMTTGPAMTREEAKQAIEVGIETARDLVAAGNKALLTGEMGIANTTASAALISVFTGADPAEVTGRGTGINDETLARKTEVVRRALEVHQPDPADPIGVLAAIGGFEHAAMVGLLLGGASLRTPVILDGVSAGAAALVARAIAPEVLAACIAGHRSAEPGHVAALNKLGLRPLVDLDLRLGEGTGALLALPLVQSTARAMHEVATFDSAGVTEK
ncbi:nicotinate-nucleotide--dimethylbenzimidazole phosphoribosyltransferase [Streptomyces sp. SLBN-115]|uniref:nicotinate-nucleotide--dimethylbenzimidazole phosphoribosyltransferase n=1 Tax=Streptomyces sp. SLBN-115 TaxID=2768453 RepID=UPI00114F7D44|nr:nicotinate-nucleotide--dimethylbenzimidazole phosphoribosyltransferase [Streptomyces sp. SLBN-115]TQJ47792.1 nicotinate-nucleotide-dimethylbenzimidazole phosphoribosyltransferase /cob(II)yrinic acid a,c-diamide reductase [Streptomyces sp. SLBN-115]